MMSLEEFTRRRLNGEGVQWSKEQFLGYVFRDYEVTPMGEAPTGQFFVDTGKEGQTIIQKGDWLFYDPSTNLTQIFRPASNLDRS